MEKPRVILVYPNLMLVSLLPNNIALLSASLKNAGCEVVVFDTTLYKTADKTNDEMRVERMQVRKFNIEEAGIKIKTSNMYVDFTSLVREFKPHLIGVSVVDDTVQMGLSLIKNLGKKRPITIFGGVNAIFNSDELVSHEEVDMVCVGEGEEVLPEVSWRIAKGQNFYDIGNLHIKTTDGSTIIKNQLNPPLNLDRLPYEDFSVFEEQRLYRPMQGKMLSMIPINFDRGCPYRCTFCDAPSIYDYYRTYNYKYYRTKSLSRIRNEIKYQISKHQVSYFYFNSETFLAMSLEKLKEFAAMYREFARPFWCQTRIETITDEKIKILKDMGCDRISIGLEHGNEEFRRKFLKKTFTNEQALKAFDILNKYSLKVSVNNMLGFPDETRELIFDTIRLNRQIKADSINGFVFQPYSGTYLREYCIKQGYLPPENSARIDNPIGSSVLKMPQLSSQEIEGLLRTFVLYVKMPEEYYPQIKEAEKLTPEGDKILRNCGKYFLRNILDDPDSFSQKPSLYSIQRYK